MPASEPVSVSSEQLLAEAVNGVSLDGLNYNNSSTNQDGESTSRSLPTEPPVQYDALQPKLKDETLERYKELRKTCCINEIPVKTAIDKIRGVTKEGKLNQECFVRLMEELANEQKVGPPKKENLVDVFRIFDKNNDGVVDMLEAVCGFALFAKGDENERLHAVDEKMQNRINFHKIRIKFVQFFLSTAKFLSPGF